MINLYQDQREFVDGIRDKIRSGHKSILGVASPAFGKTVVAGYITQQALARGNSVWFLVHRKNLLRQTSKSFWQSQIEHGQITSGKRRSSMPVQVGTIGTVYSRRDTLKPPSILFVDEAHLAKGNMFSTIIDWCRDNGAIVIGLTGTPERLDGKPLGDCFDTMVEAISTAELIETGRLSKYEFYSTPVMPDYSQIKKRGKDYDTEQQAAAMSKPVIVGDAISHWRKAANGMRTVCYCCNIKHSQATAAAFNAAGIPAVHLDGNSTEAEIKDACEGLADRRYLILCNCELIIEGFDLSAQVGRDVTLECCILLRRTLSLSRYLQMVFRALRKKPTPAVILDHAGNYTIHGLPDDAREWSLAGKQKRTSKNSEPDIQIKQCQSCYMVFKPAPACPHCGTPVLQQERTIETVDGELEKIDLEKQRKERRREQGKAQSLRDLVELGIERNMKNPEGWAVNVIAARTKKRPTAEAWKLAKQYGSEIRGQA